METGLEGTVVLVTGGAGGIGQAICRAFAADGAKVVVHYHRSDKEAEKLAGEIGGIAIKADLRVPSEANDLIKNCILEMGSLDSCVANSGYYPSENKPIWEIDEKTLELYTNKQSGDICKHC